MNDFIIDMGISIVLSAIKIAFKNNTSKESLKKALMKIKFQIELLYPDDEIKETPIPLLRKIGTRPEDF